METILSLVLKSLHKHIVGMLVTVALLMPFWYVVFSCFTRGLLGSMAG
jgi:hypothetical protein